MSTEITEDLVEQIAVIAYEDVRKKNQHARMPSWAGASEITRYEMKANALGVLRMVIPVLQEQGWMPPTVNDAIREAVRDLSVEELHKSLMKSLREHPEQGGHNTPEGLSGYSEGVDHGTISLAGRVFNALGGAVDAY